MPQRVAVLSHVKASATAVPSCSSARRIAWHGGKISSNKTEALQKFYQRKLRAGDYVAAQQIETTLNVNPSQEKSRVHPHLTKTKRPLYPDTPTTRSTTSGRCIVLKTGRVLGPKMDSKLRAQKADAPRHAKQHKSEPGTTSRKAPKPAAGVTLEDKLGLPLHALVGDKAKRTLRGVKRR